MNQVKVYNFDVWECDNVQMDLETAMNAALLKIKPLTTI